MGTWAWKAAIDGGTQQRQRAYMHAARSLPSRFHLALGCGLIFAPLPLPGQTLPDIPFQTLTLDPAHASVTATINHLGFSNYTFGFDTVAATLEFGTDRPGNTRLSAVIEVASLDIPTPPDGFLAELLGPNWLDSAVHPTITFTSQQVQFSGERTAQVTGDLQMLGASAPVTLSVTFNDGYTSAPWEPYARLGFSATTSFERSALGMVNGLPAPGTTLGVGDTVTVAIEGEFIGTPTPD